MDGLEAKVLGPLPDSTWIYPGHGKDTTIGKERPHVADWRPRLVTGGAGGGCAPTATPAPKIRHHPWVKSGQPRPRASSGMRPGRAVVGLAG